MNTKKRIILVLTAALFPFFFLGGPDSSSPRSVNHLWDMGHIIFFALATWLVLLHFRNSLAQKSFRIRFACVVSSALALGLVIEFLQYGISRSPDIGDLIKDIAGALVGLFFLSPTGTRIAGPILLTVRALVILLVLFQAVPLATALLDELNSRKKFPVLADFESSLELSRWTGSADMEIVADPEAVRNHYLKIMTGTSKYSGVSLKYFPGRWDGYDRLVFRIVNPLPNSFHVTCRIHDRQHGTGEQVYSDRFNTRYLIEPGANIISVDLDDVRNAPRTRRMDLAEICSVGIFVTGQTRPLTFYLDDLRLIRHPAPATGL